VITDLTIRRARLIADAMASLDIAQVYVFPEPADETVMEYVFKMLRDSPMAWRMDRELVPRRFFPGRRATSRVASAARYR